MKPKSCCSKSMDTSEAWRRPAALNWRIDRLTRPQGLPADRQARMTTEMNRPIAYREIFRRSHDHRKFERPILEVLGKFNLVCRQEKFRQLRPVARNCRHAFTYSGPRNLAGFMHFVGPAVVNSQGFLGNTDSFCNRLDIGAYCRRRTVAPVEYFTRLGQR